MSFGITLEELSGVSTDENGLEAFIQEARSCIFKVRLPSLDLPNNYFSSTSTFMTYILDATVAQFELLLDSERPDDA